MNSGGAGNNADNAGDDTATGSTNGTRFGANGGRGCGGQNASAVTSCVRRINRVSMTEVKNKLWTDSWAVTRWILMRIPVVQVQTGRQLS